ncbi:MAG: hypothetical protein ABI228_00050, partial [Burkholderiaceae bacterium]
MVTEINPGLAAGLLALIGLLIGLIVAAIYFRRAVAVTRTNLALSQSLAEQRGETLTALRLQLDESKNQTITLDAEKGHAERQLA